ncbi:MAG: adenylate/guanylate cyclase domain-containing protein [Leptolyngbyaceae bacterium]|nr:adenylate/guanylate cyclase domain-containing protein [Leptolyngbyaceae bacterium]
MVNPLLKQLKGKPFAGQQTQSSESAQETGSKRRRPVGPLIEVATVLLAVGIWLGNGFQPLEKWAYVALFNARQTLLPSPGWDERIAVVAIDDLTLGTTDQFPLPRSQYIQLLSKINPALPGAVVFDIVFVESTPDDGAFAQAIEESWNVVLAIAANPQGKKLELVPDLVANVAALGHVHVTPDVDGIPRRFSLYEGEMPSLSIAALQVYESNLAATVGNTEDWSPIATSYHHLFPSSIQNKPWINWPAPIPESATDCHLSHKPGDIHIYPFVCVIEGAIPASEFANKIVLVGATAQGLDPLYTPFQQSRIVASVYLHAALIDNLLNDRLLRRIPRWLEGLMLVGLGLGTVVGLRRLSLPIRVSLMVGFPLIWFGGAVLGLYASWWLPVAAPVGVVMLAFLGVQGREQWEKQQLMNLFQVYVSTESAARIWSHKDDVLSRGSVPPETVFATVLFVDIRGFTQVAENLPPLQLMSWLNRYFQSMTACIIDHHGTVDKYIGDEIMAVFAPPNQNPDAIRRSALDAIAASFAMNHELQSLNQRFQAEGLPTIEFGIGINTGPVAVGNIGGATRLNYSIVGDTVNVASRIQNINKTVNDDNPYKILVSQATYDYVGDRYAGHPVGHALLRGRQQRVLVYSILQDVTVQDVTHNTPS